jgi:hypothetical protein
MSITPDADDYFESYGFTPNQVQEILLAIQRICGHGWGEVRFTIEQGRIAYIWESKSTRPPWMRERREL